MTAKQALYQRRFALSESETDTLANRAHPPEGYRGFAEVMV